MSSELSRRLATLEKQIIRKRQPCHVQILFNPSDAELAAADREREACPYCRSKPGLNLQRAPNRIIFQVVESPPESPRAPKVEADGITFRFADARRAFSNY